MKSLLEQKVTCTTGNSTQLRRHIVMYENTLYTYCRKTSGHWTHKNYAKNVHTRLLYSSIHKCDITRANGAPIGLALVE